MKLPSQPDKYDRNFEQQRSGIIERAVNEAANTRGSYLMLIDGAQEPGPTPGQAKIFVDSVSGDLKIVFADGVVKTIVTDT